MSHLPSEQTEVFRRFDSVSDEIWDSVSIWSDSDRRAFGDQVIRSADSVGANLVEGDGRYSDADALHFFVIARASARETRYWLTKAKKRDRIAGDLADRLIGEIEAGTQMLNGLINHRRKTKNLGLVREAFADYGVSESERQTPNA